ncbi:unnamed protein product, partial [Symbiodinium sp. CCMP2456]
MDPLVRSRRGMGVKESDEASVATEKEYRAALSQAGAGMVPGTVASGAAVNGVAPGEASPGTLESGEAAGRSREVSMPVANPFHSERVRAEVDLIRSRPAALDEDAARLGLEPDDIGLGATVGQYPREPDYQALLGAGGQVREAPRVARVEPSAERAEPGIMVSDSPSRMTGLEIREKGQEEPEERRVSEEAGSPENLEEAGQDLCDDSRELIPAELDKLGRMENMLLQVMEENKSLKRRLEHESHLDVQPVLPADFPGQTTM